MNLFVNHLSPEISEDDLNRLFSEFGKIHSVKLAIDPETGLSRGFGFVVMKDKFEALDAIDHLDMTYQSGAVITVKESRQKTGASGSKPKGHSSKTSPSRPSS